MQVRLRAILAVFPIHTYSGGLYSWGNVWRGIYNRANMVLYWPYFIHSFCEPKKLCFLSCNQKFLCVFLTERNKISGGCLADLTWHYKSINHRQRFPCHLSQNMNSPPYMSNSVLVQCDLHWRVSGLFTHLFCTQVDGVSFVLVDCRVCSFFNYIFY